MLFAAGVFAFAFIGAYENMVVGFHGTKLAHKAYCPLISPITLMKYIKEVGCSGIHS